MDDYIKIKIRHNDSIYIKPNCKHGGCIIKIADDTMLTKAVISMSDGQVVELIKLLANTLSTDVASENITILIKSIKELQLNRLLLGCEL